MNQEWTGGGRPSAQEIRAALERVVASEVMRSSPQLTAFLRFVVQAVLEGNSDRIKGYVIAVEVLKRGTRFNPQIDPIVRVEATRLRRTLERADDRQKRRHHPDRIEHHEQGHEFAQTLLPHDRLRIGGGLAECRSRPTPAQGIPVRAGVL